MPPTDHSDVAPRPERKAYGPQELQGIAKAVAANPDDSERNLALFVYENYATFEIAVTRSRQSIYGAIRRYNAGRNKPCPIHGAA